MQKIIQILKLVSFFVFYFIIQLRVLTAQSSRLFINEFMASNSQTLADEAGDYDDWIEIYNDGEDSAKVKGVFLTDTFNDPTKWAFPDTAIPPKGFLIIYADSDPLQGRLHANFNLSANGEQIALFDGNNYFDSLSFGPQKTDISYGQYPDASTNWVFFTEPTPGTSNHLPLHQFTPNPIFSPPGGFFHDSVNVEILIASPTATVHYSLDCSEPTESSSIYTMPINLTKTTVIRAKAFQPRYLPSELITHTYIFDNNFDIATLSLVTDPPNLWDDNSGIYSNPNNRGNAWERPVAVELFDPGDQLCFSANAGIRISGEASRDYDKKAFRLYFRSEYGSSWLNYPLFHEKSQVDKFKRLSVHAGSTDMPANPFGYGWTLLRDPLMYELGCRLGCIYPANQPVAIFLNGVPWGIYNFMERIDKYFTESNFGELDVDLIENNTGARDGDMMEWNKLINFFENHDLSQESNYEQAKSFIDIQNFINYHILEIFGGNGDWTHHNVFSYRLRQEGARWRWILWDMDGCFGSYGVNHNTLEFATRDDPATIILRKLLKNQNYRNQFINRFADLLNTNFAYAQVNYLIDSLANVIRNDISFETEQWESSANSWEQDGVDGQLRDFARKRPDIVRFHIQRQFDLDGKVTLTIVPTLAGKGMIRINSIIADSLPWHGVYFKNIPIELEAIPAPQYLFKQWSDSMLAQTPKISLALTEDFNIAAEFELDLPKVYIIIYEINYNSAPDFDPGDWIELHNPASDTVDLSNWCFKDDDDTHKFLLPGSTKIEPDGFLVICQDQRAFHNHFPKVIHFIGDFNFGLGSEGDEVRLYNACSTLIDSVKYDNSPPWQTAPDGHGPTLELIDPNLDNNLAENWQTSIGNGTPGQPNSKPISSISPKAGSPKILLNNYLFQNYPNPFNSSTQIKYDLAIPARIQIIIYNLLGEEIAIIVDQNQSAGRHEANWDGKDKHGWIVPSGIFLYQIKIDAFIQMRKLVLIR